MTVKELRELLAQYPDDMPIVYRMHSEYDDLQSEMIQPCELFNNGGYVSEPHRAEDRALAKTYLAFPGN